MKRICLASLLLSGCYTADCTDDAAYTSPMEPVPGFLWLAADHDATVACDRFDQTQPRECPPGHPGDVNFGTGSAIDVQGRVQTTERKRIYARFYLPGLPSAIRIVEARVNLFDLRPGAADLGTRINGNPAVGAWNAETITWNTQPNTTSTGPQEFRLRPRAGQWSSSDDIAAILVEPMMRGGIPNNGFMFHYIPQGENFETSFVSDNSAGRTTADLGKAPRLLLRLSAPASCSALSLPFVSWADSDLDASLGGAPFSPVLMVRTGHTSWPASWDVPPP